MYKNIAKILTTVVYIGYIFFLLFIIDDMKMKENIETGVKNIDQYDSIVRVVPSDGELVVKFIDDYKRNFEAINEKYNVNEVMYLIKDINIFETMNNFEVDENNSLSNEYKTIPAYSINNEYLKAYPLSLSPGKEITSLEKNQIIIPRSYKRDYPMGSKVTLYNGNIEGQGVIKREYEVVGYTTRFSSIVSLNDYATSISMYNQFIVPLPELSELKTSELVDGYINTSYPIGAFIETDSNFLSKVEEEFKIRHLGEVTFLDTTTYIRGMENDLLEYQKDVRLKYLLSAVVITGGLLAITVISYWVEKEKYAYYIYHGASSKSILISRIKPNIMISSVFAAIVILIDYLVVPLFIEYYIPFSIVAIIMAIIVMLITKLLFEVVGYNIVFRNPSRLMFKERK